MSKAIKTLFLVICSLLTVACNESAESKVESNLLLPKEPVFTANPSGKVPLAAMITFSSDRELDVKLTIKSEKAERTINNSHLFQIEENNYTIPVIGMHADIVHSVTLELTDKSLGDKAIYEFAHRTPPLPDNQLRFPPIVIEEAQPEKMEPGVTFMSVRRRYPERAHWWTEKQKRFATHWGMIMAIDNSGEVVWYYESEHRVSGTTRMKNGNIMMHRANFSTKEIDLLGFSKRHFYAGERHQGIPDDPKAIPIQGHKTLHHQPYELPDGNFLAFTANPITVENFSTSETDPNAPRKTQNVIADSVVIFTPEGKTVWEWHTEEHLDTARIGYDTFWSYWWTRGFDQHPDWTHGNGLSYSSKDHSILVSLRNQLAIVKVDIETKEIVWILGRHEGWDERFKGKLLTPVGDNFMWFGYQHNPRYTPNGSVIVFDNRAHGSALAYEERPPIMESFSRAVEYEIDEENMTVRQIWSTGDEANDNQCFTYAMSEAWLLPKTNNHLVFHSFCTPLDPSYTRDVMDSSKRTPDELSYPGGPVKEYAGEELIFKMYVKDPDEILQWEIYGGFRSDIYEWN